MSAGDLAVTLAAVLCALGFTALVVVLLRVHDMLRELRREVAELRTETRPLLADLRQAADTSRHDLERFDRVLGSAEAVSQAVEGSGRAARRVFSAPVIKAAGVATGTRRVVQRLRGSKSAGAEVVHIASERPQRRSGSR
ncbi:MAG TPA: hypothetical protein VNQ73_22915 [Ilumatobacter sp.]|nr:hypothetical protein [Ilumatobacter sp.]